MHFSFLSRRRGSQKTTPLICDKLIAALSYLRNIKPNIFRPNINLYTPDTHIHAHSVSVCVYLHLFYFILFMANYGLCTTLLFCLQVSNLNLL